MVLSCNEVISFQLHFMSSNNIVENPIIRENVKWIDGYEEGWIKGGASDMPSLLQRQGAWLCGHPGTAAFLLKSAPYLKFLDVPLMIWYHRPCLLEIPVVLQIARVSMAWKSHEKHFFPRPGIRPKKKNKSVSCSRSENCNAECVFFFFFFLQFMKKQCAMRFLFF